MENSRAREVVQLALPLRRYARSGWISWGLLFVGLLSIFGGILGMLAVSSGYSFAGADHATYQAALRRMVTSGDLYTAMQNKPYDLVSAAWGTGFVYPPTSLPFLLPAALPLLAWRLLNLVSLAVIGGLITRREAGSFLPGAVLVICYPPTWAAWSNGQVTPLIAAAFGASYLWPHWAPWLGLAGGAIKFTPMLLWLWARWNGIRLRYAVIALILGVALTLPWWPAFVVAISNAHPGCLVSETPSIRCTLGGGVLGQLVALGLAAILVVASVGMSDRRIAFATLAFASIVPAPDLNWPYWLIPLIGVLPAASAVARKLPACFRSVHVAL